MNMKPSTLRIEKPLYFSNIVFNELSKLHIYYIK